MQYLPNCRYVKYVREQINDICRYADKAKIKLSGLGAFSKVGHMTLMAHHQSAITVIVRA